MEVQSYLIFNGRCEEAIDFYKKSLGAKVEMLMRFKENPDKEKMGADCMPPGGDEKVMHSSFKIGETVVMASDGMSYDQKPEFKGFSLTITAKDEAEADKLFNALCRRRQGADADRQDLLLAALRHGRRQVRRRLDGDHSAADVTAAIKVSADNDLDRNEERRLRDLARARRAARSGVEVLHRAGAHEALVGPERLRGVCLQDGSAAGRHATTTA